jgi:uncharacterized protein
MAYLAVIFVTVAQTLLALIHFFIYRTIVRFLNIPNGSLLLGMKIFFVASSVSFVAASILEFGINSAIARIFYKAAAVWMGFVFYLFLAAAVIRLLAMLPAVAGSMKPIAFALFLLAVFAGIYGVVNAGVVHITKITVPISKLPSEWKGRSAVWISDVHLGTIWRKEFAATIADKINKLKPDVVFVGGDLFDGVAGDPNDIISTFKRLNPPLGTFFVTGNHEEFGDSAKFVDAVKNAGMHVLNNEVVDVRGMQIAGVDFRESSNRSLFARILSDLNIDPAKPSVLLKHSPFDLDLAEKAGFSLQISGHTHEGQIFPLNWITRLIYRGYDYGLKRFGGMSVYTSSGTGTWGPPLRVGTISEMVEIHFE